MTTANCPTCGGPIEFKIGSSFLVVCPHCRSAIARLDRDLKDLGKVAALVETDSPLTIGLSGKYNGKSFRLTGRAQLRHALGGVWDEWYAAFDDNRWGWLAEAQGRFYMSFEEAVPDLPAFDSLAVGEPVPKLKIPLIVSEKGGAKYASADGEIPYALVPDSTSIYADLSGEHGLFATIDYSDEKPVFYAGKEVTLAQLSLDAGAAQAKPEKRVAITNLGCPNCGGSLELRAPDATERVGCPYCGSLLDCTQGKFSLLQALKKKGEQPLLQLGSVAEFEGVKQIVIGFMKRSCVVEGATYYWTEYLLYSKALGFRWLVRSDNHWSYVKPLQTAQVRPGDKFAYFAGKTFKRFQDAPAKVESVLGEFYWKVTIGETVATSDFICPPQMLSCERTSYAGDDKGHPGGGEIAWSLGEYISPDEIQTKFKLAALPSPQTVGACQPNPHQGWFMTGVKGVAAVFALTIALSIIFPSDPIFDQEIKFEAQPAAKTVSAAGSEPAVESTSVWVSEPFELKAHKKISIEAKTNLDNSWMGLEGALIDETNGEVLPFELDIEYYHGTDSDGSWSEGSQDGSHYIAAQPAGKYVMRIEGHWERMAQPISFHLVAEQTSIDPVYVFLALFWVMIFPAIGIVRKFMFESGRWSESMYGGSSSSDD